jgi:hypothetical protein
MEAARSSETPVLTRATVRQILDDYVVRGHHGCSSVSEGPI